MYQKIILAGGTGYLGSVLARHFRFSCRELIILTRSPKADRDNIRYVEWDGERLGSWCAALEGADALINLCGKEVDCRYTEANRSELCRSRIRPTQVLGEAVSACAIPPPVWLNASSATIYRHAEDLAQTEADGELGSGFSVDLCRDWEQAFFESKTTATRKVALRTSFVLGRGHGAFQKLRALVCAGLGGCQGDGRQMVSWIHEQDFARSVEWLLAHSDATGAFNITAPNPLSNSELMRCIRKACGIPFGMQAPAWVLAIAARLLQTEPELILKSRWVLPAKLEAGGFRFYYETLTYAVRDLVGARL
ncbi:MAG: TIGR01777 family protein [Chitinophagaceae bacterium]|nr:MAG: TIGR01777 family protein [Chitinophagaceae bacterium]